jgi:hypothetical protein
MTIYPCDTPKNAMYPYACDYNKWGFSDKNGNIKVPCKYEATYIVQGTCRYPQVIREDSYFVRKKGKLYILDRGKEIRFSEVDTLPLVYSIDSLYIVFSHHRIQKYQIYLRSERKLINTYFFLPPSVDKKSKLIYGTSKIDSVCVVSFKNKKLFTFKGQGITKFGKTFLVIEDYKTVRIINEKSKRLNTNIYSNFVYNDEYLYLSEFNAPVKLLLPNGKFYDTKLFNGEKSHINFYNYKGVSLFSSSHAKDTLSIYNQLGTRFISENIKNVVHGANFTYLIGYDKTFQIGPNNEIFNCIDYSIDEKKGNTFIKYFGSGINTHLQIIDTTYLFDENLHLIKRYDGFVFDVFFDSLYYVNNKVSKYLSDYKNDTLIYCDKSKYNIKSDFIYDEVNSCIRRMDHHFPAKYLEIKAIDFIDYNFENGNLIQKEKPRLHSYFCPERRTEDVIECIIDTSRVKHEVIDYAKKYQNEAKLKERNEALENARFENNRLFGYLNVNRDTIMPFIYEYAVPHRNFITFEKDTIWTVFDTVTYESKTYDMRNLLKDYYYHLLPNLFYTVDYPPNRYFQIVHHLQYGVLFDGKPVSYFSDYWNDFMFVQFEEKGPEKLIHAPSGVLIDDYEEYQSYDRYTYEYDLEIYYKENHVFMSNNKTCKIDFYNLTFEPQANDGSRRINYDLTVFKFNENALFMNPETMKFLASDELMEKLRIKKYKSIYPE